MSDNSKDSENKNEAVDPEKLSSGQQESDLGDESQESSTSNSNQKEDIMNKQKSWHSELFIWIVKNSKFTNVPDTSNLRVNKFNQVGTTPFKYKMYFEEQVIGGLTVEESRIIVFFYVNYVYQIRGSWYPEIPIPPKEYGLRVSEAKIRIIGYKIEYYCKY